jgi:very-short-patch-repair endonuclease
LLRKKQTVAEATLWRYLRNRQLNGIKFVRQYPIEIKYMQQNRFVVFDFYSHAEKVAIEIDGSIHDNRHEIDQFREDLLAKLGIRFIRFTNYEILNSIENVLQKITDFLNS